MFYEMNALNRLYTKSVSEHALVILSIFCYIQAQDTSWISRIYQYVISVSMPVLDVGENKVIPMLSVLYCCMVPRCSTLSCSVLPFAMSFADCVIKLSVACAWHLYSLVLYCQHTVNLKGEEKINIYVLCAGNS